jgi:TetR/AcrR family transcriptional regulator
MYRMRFKTAKSTLDASTREEILNVAQKVFGEIGFKEATVRQICKAAKANVCLISYYFGGKDGLYKAVFERTAKLRMELMKNILEDVQSTNSKEAFKMRLHLILEQMYKEISSKPDFFKLMHREMIDGLPRAEQIIKNYFGMILDLFCQFLEYGQKSKFLKKELDPKIATLCMINMITGAISQQHADSGFFFKGIDEKEIPEKLVKTISHIFFDGVLQ